MPYSPSIQAQCERFWSSECQGNTRSGAGIGIFGASIAFARKHRQKRPIRQRLGAVFSRSYCARLVFYDILFWRAGQKKNTEQALFVALAYLLAGAPLGEML